jgi:hypothetical protein
MYSNWNYQNLWGKICRIEKNPIILCLKSTNWVMMNFFKFLLLTIFSILYAFLLQKHIQSHIPNNHKVINKNKMSCNTLCPCISSVGEQYSRILHNMHFDHVIWHHNAFCNIFVWKMSLWVCYDIYRPI